MDQDHGLQEQDAAAGPFDRRRDIEADPILKGPSRQGDYRFALRYWNAHRRAFGPESEGHRYKHGAGTHHGQWEDRDEAHTHDFQRALCHAVHQHAEQRQAQQPVMACHRNMGKHRKNDRPEWDKADAEKAGQEGRDREAHISPSFQTLQGEHVREQAYRAAVESILRLDGGQQDGGNICAPFGKGHRQRDSTGLRGKTGYCRRRVKIEGQGLREVQVRQPYRSQILHQMRNAFGHRHGNA